MATLVKLSSMRDQLSIAMGRQGKVLAHRGRYLRDKSNTLRKSFIDVHGLGLRTLYKLADNSAAHLTSRTSRALPWARIHARLRMNRDSKVTRSTS